jgi:hypothetical protein
MKNFTRRLRTIEVTLTPEQITLAWFREAQSAGGFYDAWRSFPEPRTYIANAVAEAVRETAKALPEALLKSAILEAQKRADFLYSLAIEVNVVILESEWWVANSFMLLDGYIRTTAEARNEILIQELRTRLLPVVRKLLILDEAIAKLRTEYFCGQEMLFRESYSLLRDQVENVHKLVAGFNVVASTRSIAEIETKGLLCSLQTNIDQQVAKWIHIARLESLSVFGPEDSWRSLTDQIFPTFNSESTTRPISGERTVFG